MIVMTNQNIHKNILEKYRDIGTVDLSFRTFEWQGMDCYNRKIVDKEFYYKKPCFFFCVNPKLGRVHSKNITSKKSIFNF